MKRLWIAVLIVLVPSLGIGQERKIPVSVSRTGKDRIGSMFAASLSRQLAESSSYELMPAKGANKGLRFYIQLATVDLAADSQGRGNRSAVSVVVEDMGTPNSFPVASMWYHKIILVDRQASDRLAKELVEDVSALWCKTIKNSEGGCPKEKL